MIKISARARNGACHTTGDLEIEESPAKGSYCRPEITFALFAGGRHSGTPTSLEVDVIRKAGRHHGI
jgi:hypothetical protein